MGERIRRIGRMDNGFFFILMHGFQAKNQKKIRWNPPHPPHPFSHYALFFKAAQYSN